MHDEISTDETTGLSRRKMVALGAFGGLGGAALAGTVAATAAHAADGPGGGPAKRSSRALDAEPAAARIGSAAIGGYTYLHRSFMDFQPYTGGNWAWTGTGIYTAESGAFGQLGCGLDLPPGAYVRDVEFYVAGTTTGQVAAYLWSSGSASFALLGVLSVPTTGGTLVARRLALAESAVGPYALGVRLLLWANSSSTFVLNGARVGYSSMPTGTTALGAPVRVIDSRSTTKIGNGQTRIHDLSSRIPAGATSAILNVSVTSGEKSGGIAVYNTGSTVPSGSALYYNGGTTISSEIHVKLPSDRKIKITNRGATGCKAHYFMDLVGYTA